MYIHIHRQLHNKDFPLKNHFHLKLNRIFLLYRVNFLPKQPKQEDLITCSTSDCLWGGGGGGHSLDLITSEHDAQQD